MTTPYGDMFGRHPTARDPSQEDSRVWEERLEEALDELDERAAELVELVMPGLSNGRVIALADQVAAVLRDAVRQRVADDLATERADARRYRGDA